jgi:hypothetical protein
MPTCLQVSKRCVIPEGERDAADLRHQRLQPVPHWIRPAMEPFRRLGSCKADDWKKLLQYGAEYVFGDSIPAQMKEAFWALIGVLRDVLDATCDVESGGEHDPDASRDWLRRLKRKAVRALCLMERDVPATEWAIIIHIIMHLPECIYRWNNVRNTWAFPNERYVTLLWNNGTMITY